MSFYNDTDDTIMVKRTVNTKVIAPIAASMVAIVGSVVTVMTAGGTAGVAAAGTTITYSAIVGVGIGAAVGVATMTNDLLFDDFEDNLIAGYKEEGFIEVKPRTEKKWGKQSLSLNQRLFCTRFTRDGDVMHIRTATSSVWTGATNNSNIKYKASNRSYFDWEIHDTYKIEVESDESRAEGETRYVDPRDPTLGGKKVVSKLFGCF